MLQVSDMVFLILNFFMQVNMQVNILPVTYPQSHSQAMVTPDDLPKTVARALIQGSAPMSMDFHPIQQTILLGELLRIARLFILILVVNCLLERRYT